MKISTCLVLLLSQVVLQIQAHASTEGWEQFLADNVEEFENVQIEWEDPSKIPPWLRGTYLKNGPARTSFGGEKSYQNQIDGWAKINKFQVSSKGVVFSAKFLKTHVYQKSVEAGDLVPQATLGPINPTGWSWEEMRNHLDNRITNTDVTIDRMGDEFIASTDLNEVNVFDVKTLELKESIDPFGVLPMTRMRLASCAHWRKDLTSNDMFNYDITFVPAAFGQFLRLYRFPKGNLRNPQHVNEKLYRLPFQTLVHYFSVTENYAVFFLYPIHMDITNAIFDDTPMQNMLEHIVWEGDRKATQIMIIDLETGELLTKLGRLGGPQTTSEAILPRRDSFGGYVEEEVGFYGTHHINAFETSQKNWWGGVDRVVVTDVIIPPYYALQNYTDRTVLLEAKDDGVSTSTPFRIVRFTTNLRTFETESKDWNELFPVSSSAQAFANQFDFPNINPNYNGREYCYAYGLSMVNFRRHYIVKKNLCQTGKDMIWSRDHHYAGEPYFIANPDAKAEDDGVILNLVLDGNTQKSYLIVLDAQTMTELTVAKLDTHVPMSIHGNWFDGEMF